jgi:hypothetical protein
MSLLPQQAIDEFQRLWKKHYGADLPRENAVLRAHQIYALFQMLTEADEADVHLSAVEPSAIEPSGAPSPEL